MKSTTLKRDLESEVAPKPGKRRLLSLLAVLLTAGVALLACRWCSPARLPAYQGKSLSVWLDRSICEADPEASRVLAGALPFLDVSVRARTEAELRSRLHRALRAKGDGWWGYYQSLQSKLPPALARWVPAWRNPAKVRGNAANWLSQHTLDYPWEQPAGSLGGPAAILAEASRNDPDGKVARMVNWAVGSYGLGPSEYLDRMFQLLNHPDYQVRTKAVGWFASTRAVPERVVPLLVRGLEDNAMRSKYAEALRAYGLRASFVTESLQVLSRTNNRPTASLAEWVLAGMKEKGGSAESKRAQFQESELTPMKRSWRYGQP